METVEAERVIVQSEDDLVRVRQRVRHHAIATGLSLVNQTKLVTAASELSRNMLKYACGGETLIEPITENDKTGLKLVFSDEGPGITDLDLAMTDGYTTGGGMGLGLSGSKRLVNEFFIDSEPGKGTTITIIRWK